MANTPPYLESLDALPPADEPGSVPVGTPPSPSTEEQWQAWLNAFPVDVIAARFGDMARGISALLVVGAIMCGIWSVIAGRMTPLVTFLVLALIGMLAFVTTVLALALRGYTGAMRRARVDR